ncbi:restriction endonuclease [Chloroflexus sp.]|uniref:restriction endonuclease n=1 Tax=Chloroflexus sp. TaxID=1904827 RepID=UPI002ADE8E9B|nr:restriction endonuclease [Chloroflexus sp.]
MKVTVRDAAAHARRLGYHIIAAEQLRDTRCFLVLAEPAGQPFAVLIQRRALITAADVQDFAEMLFLRRLDRGLLIAVDGGFSNEARRTAQELRQAMITLTTDIPPASGFATAGLNPVVDLQ